MKLNTYEGAYYHIKQSNTTRLRQNKCGPGNQGSKNLNVLCTQQATFDKQFEQTKFLISNFVELRPEKNGGKNWVVQIGQVISIIAYLLAQKRILYNLLKFREKQHYVAPETLM